MKALRDKPGIDDVPDFETTPNPETMHPSGNTRPTLILPGDGVSITEAATNLYKLIAPTHQLFVRGKVVVALSRTIAGQLVLEPVRPSAARSLFEKFAQFFAWRVGKHNEKVLKPVVMAEETARALLDCYVAAEILPGVNGLVNCPVISETDGKLSVCGKGYSSEAGLLVLRGEIPEDVPLVEAVEGLKRLLVHYHFQSLSDQSRAVASFITPAMKMGKLIHGHVPVDVAEADQPQSGKTLRQKMLAAIYGETPALVPLKRDGVGGIDESFYEKLVNGRPFIQFDNFRGILDSPALEAFLTADGSFPCRIPHVREIEVDPSRFFILLTSNGVETTADLAKRSNIVRIYHRPDAEFPDTLGQIRSRQTFFLGCVFSLVKEWHRQGKQRSRETRHDFRDWCQPLDWIVQNLCGLAPLMDGHRGAQERVSNPILTFLRRVALEVDRLNLLGIALIASRIFELADAADIQVPGLRKEDTHNEDKAKRVIGSKLATVFNAKPTLELDGFTIMRTEEQRTRSDGSDGGGYALKAYTFDRQPQQPQQPL